LASSTTGNILTSSSVVDGGYEDDFNDYEEEFEDEG
jgi:hypothetical protein